MAIKSAIQTEASVETITVADLLPDLDIPDEIGAALYTGSQEQLVNITQWLGMQHGKDTLYTLTQPTPSALVVKRRSKGTPDRRRRGTPFSDNMMLVC